MFEPPKVDLRSVPVQLLSYIGDGIMNLHFRMRFADLMNVSKIENVVRKIVSKEGQATILDAIWKDLKEDEISVVKRAMNGRFAKRHGNDPAYRKSTGLEALVGYLYIKGDFERLEWIFERGERICGG